MHPKKCLKSPLNRSHAWFLALSDGHPIENSKANPARQAHRLIRQANPARTLPHACTQQAKQTQQAKRQAKNNRQGFALVTDTKNQQAYKTKKPKKGPFIV
jgi:hypothetical protein